MLQSILSRTARGVERVVTPEAVERREEQVYTALLSSKDQRILEGWKGERRCAELSLY